MVHLKSERELVKMRASADLVGRTLAQVAQRIEPGVRLIELDQLAETFIRDHGATPSFKGYHMGDGVNFPGSLCISVNDVIVHGIPNQYRLRAGDLISVDCGAYLNGYHGDSAFTFAVGEISEADAQLCRVTYESLYKGIEQSVHGNRVGDIGHAVQEHCERHGFGVVEALVGHGIGRKLHEDPSIPNVGTRGKGKRLKAGMTFCIEPMINRGTEEVYTAKDGWTVHTADGLNSAHYEHMVAIRKGQPAEILTTFKYIEAVITPPYQLTEVTHG